jgi:ABC-type Zn uptake system ZnuABC Zn-binding protein ZnuA
MKRLILFCSLFLLLVLAACGGTSAPEQALEEGDGPIVTVYKSPT